MTLDKSAILACGVLAATLTRGAQQITCYVATPTEVAPVIDGDLSDEAWKSASVFSDYFAFGKGSQTGTLPTTLRVAYDDHGVYVAIENAGPQPEERWAHNAVVDQRSAAESDCAEIYFDPEGLSIGFVKFVANVVGGWCDYKRQDGQVLLDNWSGAGWRFKTKRSEELWTIEAAFPWVALEHRAKPGDVWRLLHTRFHWTGERHALTAVSSSPNGSYVRPDCYGYLYFQKPGETTDLESVGRIVAKDVGNNWFAVSGGQTVMCDGDGIVRMGTKSELDEAEARAKDEEDEWRRKLEERFK